MSFRTAPAADGPVNTGLPASPPPGGGHGSTTPASPASGSPAAPGAPSGSAAGLQAAAEELGQPFANARILIVDDEPANVRLLERMLARAGFTKVRSLTDPRETMALFAEFEPDMVLLDLNMPGLNGLEVMELIREVAPADVFLPIVVLTADVSSSNRLKALEVGATDFLTKPFDHTEVVLRIENLLQTRRMQMAMARAKENLENTVRERTADLTEALAEVRAMQTHLVQQERLSAFGTMAGGIVHDFNNALSMILGYGELLLADDDDDGPSSREQRRNFVKNIITAATDAAGVVSRLREFYRPAEEGEVWEHVDLCQLAEQAINMTSPRWKTRSDTPCFVTADVKPVPFVAGNAAELRELFTNLIFNAVDAMPQGGEIVLRTWHEGGHVVAEIADTGVGMSEEVRKRCLEPFFTTKGDKGTGLGLAMVYGIAQRHRAHMEIHSQPGEGTTFRFTFPVDESPGAAAHISQPEAHRAASPKTVLVVDDQPVICEIVSEYLKHDCHDVEAVSSGEEALALVGTRGYDLLITDQSMPGCSGGELATRVKEMRPEMRIILLTGYGKDEAPEEGAGAIDLVVGKPVGLEALRRAVAEVFHERP